MQLDWAVRICGQLWNALRPDTQVLVFQGRCGDCLETALAWVRDERRFGRSPWVRAKGLSLVERCQLAAVHGAFTGLQFSEGDDAWRGLLLGDDQQVSASRKRLRAERVRSRGGSTWAS